jgi:4-amino-4-deoxy-L-arabinose transferase-like glycosyltransferase
VAAILGLYLILATARLDRPGLHYDETLFVQAALGGGGRFVRSSLLGIPIMLMSYIGALKAYFYYPIFKVFGVSPTTIRLPAILLMALALVITYLLARRFMGRWLAISLLSVVATSPALVVSARADFGPIVLMTFLKMAALYLLFSYLKDRRLLHLFLLLTVLLLGIFDKLNFLWFVGALTIAAPVVFWPELKEALFEQRSKTLLVGGGAFAIGAFMLSRILPTALSDMSRKVALPDQLSKVLHLYAQTLDGSDHYWLMTSKAIPRTSVTPWLIVPAGILGLLAIGVLFSRSSPWRPQGFRFRVALFFLLLFLATLGIMVLTPQTSGPHHMLILWAFPEFAIFVSIAELTSRLSGKSSRRALAAIAVSVVLVLSSQLFVVGEYLAAFGSRGPYSVAWNPAIYRLSEYLENESDSADNILLTDWGMGTQLYGLAKAEHRLKYLDYWPRFVKLQKASPEDIAANAKWLFEGKRVLVVTHLPSKEIFKGTGNAFKAVAASPSLTVAQIATIAGDDGQDIFQVFRVLSK